MHPDLCFLKAPPSAGLFVFQINCCGFWLAVFVSWSILAVYTESEQPVKIDRIASL